jgi:aryl-alcohol dehydrogenase-like predicted oxidoreductase
MTSRKAINAATGRLSERNLAIARVVGEVAGELGLSAPQVALAWTLLDPAITSPIIGARTLAQFQDNLGALDVSLTGDHIVRLDTASRVDPGFPHDMLASPAIHMTFGGVTVEPRR